MKVIMIYGSENDKPFMQPARDYLDGERMAYDEEVLSVHRDTEALIAYLDELNESDEKIVILAIAGLSAALPGFVAVKVEAPVIGVPVPGGPLNGIDALLSVIQVPGGVPLVGVGLHKKAPANAAMYAHKILKMAGA